MPFQADLNITRHFFQVGSKQIWEYFQMYFSSLASEKESHRRADINID